MKIRFLKSYSLNVKGDIIDVNKPIADLLIGRQVAEEVKEIKKVKKCSGKLPHNQQ